MLYSGCPNLCLGIATALPSGANSRGQHWSHTSVADVDCIHFSSGVGVSRSNRPRALYTADCFCCTVQSLLRVASGQSNRRRVRGPVSGSRRMQASSFVAFSLVPSPSATHSTNTASAGATASQIGGISVDTRSGVVGRSAVEGGR
eukprot:4924991-Prymnesium_polylepis.1